MSNIAIINYECGNIHSARKAFELALTELRYLVALLLLMNPKQS